MNWNLTTKRKNDEWGLDIFKRDISKLFDDFFTAEPSFLFESEWSPTIDVEEENRAIHIKAEIPGIDEKDINVTLENNILTLSGEKREERKEEKKEKKYLFSERRFGYFYRTITLPGGIQGDNIKASFKKGILKIDIPKDETKEPKKISIRVN